MIEKIMEYQVYIFMGICSIPILIYIIYFTRKLIERTKIIQGLNYTKKPLLEKINTIETEEVRMIIENIKRDISTIKEEITTSQEKIAGENKRRIEEQISIFYDEINNIQRKRETYQSTQQGTEDTLHKEQVRIMNQNIRKFLVVYKEKDEIIEEKNRSIDLLQQKLKKIEQKAQEKTLNESQNKDTPKQLLHKKLYDIEETIESEKRKKITFIVLCILFLTLSIGRILAMYTYYIQNNI